MPAGFFMTDPARVNAPIDIVKGLPAGIGVIIRHMGRPDAISEAGDIAAICKRAGRICLIGADAELARVLDADGVHWPARLQAEARRLASYFPVNTMSVHSLREVRRAEQLGMDGVIASTVFASASPSSGAPMGLTRLARLQAATPLPVYGLGGVSADNVERTSRLAGFASVSGFEVLRVGPP